MAWTKETAADGSPVWRGNDSIFDMTENYKWGGFAIGIAAVIVGLLITISGSFIGLLVMIGGIPLAVVIQNKQRKAGAHFVRNNWIMAGGEGHLSFKGKQSWAVPLDAVASVETGRTQDYTPTRRFEQAALEMDRLQSVPEHEWQTFLFLNDGTRRVIYHANSGRDDCAALAASIREYLNAAAPAVAPSAPDAARPSAFDL